MERVEVLLLHATKLLANITVADNQESLYYLCLLLYKAHALIDGYIKPGDTESLCLLILQCSEVTQQTKELALLSVYSILARH